MAPKSPATVAAGFSPNIVAVAPDGKSAYVTNLTGDNVSQYDIGPGGLLAPKTPAKVAAGSGPLGLAVIPASPDLGAGTALGPATAFSIVTLTASQAGTITAVVDTPAGGQLCGVGWTRVRLARVAAARQRRTKTIAYGSGSTSSAVAGRLTVRVRPSRVAKTALKRAGTLRVAVTFTFQASGGAPVRHTRSVTVKPAHRPTGPAVAEGRRSMTMGPACRCVHSPWPLPLHGTGARRTRTSAAAPIWAVAGVSSLVRPCLGSLATRCGLGSPEVRETPRQRSARGLRTPGRWQPILRAAGLPGTHRLRGGRSRGCPCDVVR